MDSASANNVQGAGGIGGNSIGISGIGKRIGITLFKGIAVGFFLGLIIFAFSLIPLAVVVYEIDKYWLYAISKSGVYYLRATLLFMQSVSILFGVLYFVRKEFVKVPAGDCKRFPGKN